MVNFPFGWMQRTGRQLHFYYLGQYSWNIWKMEVKDSNGNVLNDGDSVTLIKDLKVKGSSLTLKRGTVVKKIRLTEDEQEVDCRVNGSSIVLRTEFLKKIWYSFCSGGRNPLIKPGAWKARWRNNQRLTVCTQIPFLSSFQQTIEKWNFHFNANVIVESPESSGGI